MNPEVLTVSEDMTVQELAAFLQDNEISGAPVEDRNGRLVGVVSVVDVARAASFEGYLRLAAPDYFGRPAKAHAPEEELDEAVDAAEIEGLSLRVADIMTPALYGVEEDTPVASIADVMLHGHLHRVLVLRGQKLVGIVSSSDLLGLLVGE
jgi:CBS domain-containing protein